MNFTYWSLFNWVIILRRKMNDKLLKTAFSEFYLSLIMTQNYVKHNLLGFQKIMKKFDKNLNCKVN